MQYAGCQAVVMEVSSHALDMNRIYGIEYDEVAFTNLTQDHLDYHKTLEQYAKAKDTTAYEFLKDKKVWKCIKGFGDTDIVLKFTPEHLKYFESLEQIAWNKDSVSNIAWKLQHYEDKAETPLPLVIRYLMQNVCQTYQKACIDCLNDLNENRISKNAIISKLVFELKYTE